MPSIAIANHPERNVIRAQLAQNIVLKEMLDGEREELEPHLLVVDCAKGESLLDQGVHDMEQYFVLDGVLKRVVTNANAKEMILRFAFEHEVMRLMSEIMAHTITLHLLDAPGRVRRFMRKHPELEERIPKKELAAYLNLSAETLSRLKQRG